MFATGSVRVSAARVTVEPTVGMYDVGTEPSSNCVPYTNTVAPFSETITDGPALVVLHSLDQPMRYQPPPSLTTKVEKDECALQDKVDQVKVGPD